MSQICPHVGTEWGQIGTNWDKLGQMGTNGDKWGQMNSRRRAKRFSHINRYIRLRQIL